jgi:hypothetical protein
MLGLVKREESGGRQPHYYLKASLSVSKIPAGGCGGQLGWEEGIGSLIEVVDPDT